MNVPPDVLIVDDDAIVRRLMHTGLANAGFSVIEAAAGEEALAMFRKNASSLRMVVTDVTMPGMNGPDLAALLRQEDTNLKILFVSGSCDECVDSLKGCELLRKPFRLAELSKRVSRMLQATG